MGKPFHNSVPTLPLGKAKNSLYKSRKPAILSSEHLTNVTSEGKWPQLQGLVGETEAQGEHTESTESLLLLGIELTTLNICANQSTSRGVVELDGQDVIPMLWHQHQQNEAKLNCTADLYLNSYCI